MLDGNLINKLQVPGQPLDLGTILILLGKIFPDASIDLGVALGAPESGQMLLKRVDRKMTRKGGM